MINKLKKLITTRIRNEKGQGMVEYALIIGLVAVVVIAVLVLLGPAISAKFTQIVNALK